MRKQASIEQNPTTFTANIVVLCTLRASENPFLIHKM